MNTRIVAALALAAVSLACRREATPPVTPGTGQPATVETVVATEDASTAAIDLRVPLTANAVAKCTPSKSSFGLREPVVLTLELN
jgi:hypothetical protein